MGYMSRIMAAFMSKFKRKRRLSTELHPRWGDTSITHPSQGSWNQWDQPSGFVANMPERASSRPQYDQGQRHLSVGSLHQPSPSTSAMRSRSTILLESPVEISPETPSFPTGHFNQNIRHRDTGERPQLQGLGISDLRLDWSSNTARLIIDDDSSSCSCDEDEEDRDIPGALGVNPRIYELADTSQPPRDHTDDYDIPAKSPLSVTSRMRRESIYSYATAPAASLSSGTTSSRRTSYTAASSVTAPSMPSNSSHYSLPNYQPGLSAFADKRNPPPPLPRGAEFTTQQQMVPSYDDLYG